MTGAGATFPYPIYAKWAEAYKAKTGSNMNYQSIGSSGGIKQIKAKTVDFGATDNPVKFDDLEKDGLVQFPAIIGGVVPVINVEGVKPYELKLSPDTLSDIFQGVIVNWNDKRIVLNNPGMKMPDLPITVVHRADGSGTTAIFTNYLAKVSQNWKDAVGEGAAVKWAIGYVEYAYAKKNKMTSVSLKNKDGQFVQPDDITFAAAAAGTDWSKIPGMGTFITNAAGAKSWPITGASFILVYKNPENKANAAEVIKFFDFAFKDGKKMAEELDYVPMPDVTTDFIRKNVFSKVATK
jgi:phosphate transport system substrate-binding protein